MEVLPKLFGSRERVKLLKLFLYNQDLFFSLVDISKRTKIRTALLKRELELFEEISFVASKKLVATSTPAGKKKTQAKSPAKGKVWLLNRDFFYLEHLRAMFNADFLASHDELAERFKNCGKIKMVVLSGMFMQEGGTRADLLIVGDDLRRTIIEGIVATIESEIGRELVYAILDTRDYDYRFRTSDRFVRDIMDYPHRRLIDKMEA
ncbi:MAG: hypothetical protein NT041_01620 [Candidatus Vogelbacteria bacterium]|nr:hypothetical protein [Candidatus Vogelbacteria bacterium]